MKMLAVSLLRLGDVVLTTPVLRGFKQKNPQVEIHVLMNRQFSGISDLIPYVDKFYYFDRDDLQDSIGNPDRGLLEGFDQIETLLCELNQEKYDSLINLTQNKLSGWISSLIECDDKKGLVFDDRGHASFGSSWFRYLNDYVALGGQEVFHYVDVFYFGAGLGNQSRELALIENEQGRQDSLNIIGSRENFVVVQVLTSDPKKTWNADKLRTCLKLFTKINPGYKILLLGSEAESAEIKQFAETCQAAQIDAIAAICDLKTAFSLLNRARLLLTADTSIKHLACAADCRILELSLGSSDYRKTGVYKPGSFIIQSKEYCSPCSHRSQCHRESHACSERISPEVVALSMSHAVNGSSDEMRLVAKEFEDQVQIFETHFSHTGYWLAKSLTESADEHSIGRWIERGSWKFLLEKEHSHNIAEYGSESLRLQLSLNEIFPKSSQLDFLEVYKTLEGKIVEREKKLERVKNQLNRAIRNSSSDQFWEDFINECGEYGRNQKIDPFLQSLLQKSHQGPMKKPTFQQIRTMQSQIREFVERNHIQLKIVRSLKSNLTGGL